MCGGLFAAGRQKKLNEIKTEHHSLTRPFMRETEGSNEKQNPASHTEINAKANISAARFSLHPAIMWLAGKPQANMLSNKTHTQKPAEIGI